MTVNAVLRHDVREIQRQRGATAEADDVDDVVAAREIADDLGISFLDTFLPAETADTTDELAEWQLAMATAILAMLPPVAVVVFMQRLFVRGLVETEK